MGEPRHRRKEAAEPVAEVQTYGGFRIDQLMDVVRRTEDSTGAPGHPAEPTNATAAATNALAYYEILRIVRGGRPADGDPRRQLYDLAVGDGTQQEALEALSAAHASVLQRLSTYGVRSLDPEMQTRLLEMVQDISLNMDSEGYGPGYAESREAIDNLISALGGTPAEEGDTESTEAVPASEDAEAGQAQPLPELRLQLWQMGAMRPLGMDPDRTVGQYGAERTDFVEVMYGCIEGSACTAGDALVNAYADVRSFYLQQGSYSGEGSDALARALGGQLGRATGPVRELDGFDDAVAALNRGDLTEGMRLLQDMPELYGSLGETVRNLHIIRVTAEAVVVFSAEATVRFDLDPESSRSLRPWVERAATDPTWHNRLLWFGLSAYYQLLSVHGQYQAGETVSNWDELGHVVGLRGELAGGVRTGRGPMEIIGYASLDITSWQHNEEIQMAGGRTDTLTAGQDWDFSIALAGIEFRFPGRTGQLGRWIRCERAGAAGTYSHGMGDRGGAVVYATFTGRWYEGDVFTFGSSVTPEVRYMLDQIRLGGSVDPAQMVWAWRDRRGDHAISLSPITYRGQVDVLQNPGDMRHEIGATFGYEWRGGIRVSVSGGAVADGLGVPGETRWSPSVGLQFEINPTALHQRRMAATPRRVGGAAVVTIPEAVRSEYRDAVGTLSGDDAEVQAQAAEDLASRLRSAAGISGGRNQLGRISTDSHFTAALRALDGGNLEEGIRELRQIPAFRDLETNPPTEPRTQDREQDSVGPGGFAIPRAEE